MPMKTVIGQPVELGPVDELPENLLELIENLAELRGRNQSRRDISSGD